MNVADLMEALDEYGGHLPVVLSDELTGAVHEITSLTGAEVDGTYSVVLSAE